MVISVMAKEYKIERALIDQGSSANILYWTTAKRKFPAGRTVATVWADATVAKRCYEDSLRVESTTKGPGVNVLDFDLDSRYFSTEERPHPVGDLKEVKIGPSNTQKTKISNTLDQEEEDQLV
ncbi:hypothetical protein CR513_47718, partial [Mucuna pruriens]